MLQTSSKAHRCHISKATINQVNKALNADDISCHGVTASKWSVKQTNAAFRAAKLKQQAQG